MINKFLKKIPKDLSSTPWGPWWSIILSGLALLLSSIVATIVATIAYPSISRGIYTGYHKTIVMLLSSLIICPLIIGLCRIKTKEIRQYLGLTSFKFKELAFWTIVLLIFESISFSLLCLFSDYKAEMQSMIDLYRQCDSCIPLFWVAIVLAAPFWEELVFRGFIFRGFSRSRLGAVGAIVIPTILWAAMHTQYNIFTIVTVMFTGVILTLARLYGNSLYIPIIMHMINNGIATVVLYFHIQG